MHALVLLCINQHTKFEVPSFTNSKDIIGANFKNGSCDHDHAHQGVVCHRKPNTWYIPPATKFGDCNFSRSRDMIVGVKTEKNESRDTDHAPLRVVSRP